MPNAVPRVTRAPTDVYAEVVNFSGWSDILTSTNTLSSASASVSPSGPTLGPVITVDATNKKVSVPWSGGTDGVKYRLTVLATTSGGDTLTGYVDVHVSTASTDGVVVYPSQFLPYIDGARAMEVLVDEGELEVGAAYPAATLIDGVDRARKLADAAWYELQTACRRGNIYQGRELIDLANDVARGQALIELLADLFWAKLMKRRRYLKGEPQGEDAGYDRAQAMLQALRTGERIFDLTGVAVTDADGNATGAVYSNELAGATTLSVGRFGATDRTGRDGRFWGCTNDDRNAPGSGGRCW